MLHTARSALERKQVRVPRRVLFLHTGIFGILHVRTISRHDRLHLGESLTTAAKQGRTVFGVNADHGASSFACTTQKPTSAAPHGKGKGTSLRPPMPKNSRPPSHPASAAHRPSIAAADRASLSPTGLHCFQLRLLPHLRSSIALAQRSGASRTACSPPFPGAGTSFSGRISNEGHARKNRMS